MRRWRLKLFKAQLDWWFYLYDFGLFLTLIHLRIFGLILLSAVVLFILVLTFFDLGSHNSGSMRRSLTTKWLLSLYLFKPLPRLLKLFLLLFSLQSHFNQLALSLVHLSLRMHLILCFFKAFLSWRCLGVPRQICHKSLNFVQIFALVDFFLHILEASDCEFSQCWVIYHYCFQEVRLKEPLSFL